MATASITQLIINSPYEEPAEHWKYDPQSRTFSLEKGRRPAGYVSATPGAGSFDDPGIFVPLPLVNQIRPRVKAWRESGYAGASGVTLALLKHWHDPEQRDRNRRLFFCQLEALETLICLTEAPEAQRQGIEIPSDGGPFARLCSKMATGSGKTIAMAMLRVASAQQDHLSARQAFLEECLCAGARADGEEPVAGAHPGGQRQFLR